MPLYGNTHSDSSSSSIQTSYYREEARAYIKTSTNSNHDDLLIFTSNGATVDYIYIYIYTLGSNQ